MKKTVSVLAVFILILYCFTSCGTEDGKESANSTAGNSSAEIQSQTDNTSEEMSEETDPLAHIEQQNLNRTVTFLVNGDIYDRYMSVEILPNDNSPDLISEAVAERNRIVEQKLGVNIAELRVTADQMMTRIRTAASSSANEFDVAMPYLYVAAALTSEKMFYDLNDFSNIINFDADYWNKQARDALTIDNKLYFATGDFSLLSFECTHAIVFNKTVLNRVEGESPYSLVESGNWTYDTLTMLAKLATAETDGTDGMTYKDSYGFWVDGDYILSMFIGSGERLSTKDGDDFPAIDIYTNRSVDVIKSLTDLVNDKTSSFYIESCHTQAVAAGDKDCYFAATKAFAEGRALFRSLSLVDLHELSAFEVDYGILPTPKYNTEQDDYYCFGSTQTVTAAAIPISHDDPATVALVLEAMAAASQNTVKYNYYEVLLKSRKIQDQESEIMLDVIFKNRVYDLADIYNWGGIRSLVVDTVTNGGYTFTSKWQSVSDAVISKMEETIDFFRE
ncbi:MAG: extracellular solute-binding protein [Eubacteriales bacterium]|nr:extracellular solute-binding protein [Eubacteriales bacterium]